MFLFLGAFCSFTQEVYAENVTPSDASDRDLSELIDDYVIKKQFESNDEQLEKFISVGEACLYTNELKTGIALAGQILQRIETISDQCSLSKFYFIYGRLLAASGRCDDGIKALERGVNVENSCVAKNKKLKVFLLNNIGNTISRCGDIYTAISYYKNCLNEIKESIKTDDVLSLKTMVLLNLAKGQLKTSDTESALSNLNQAAVCLKKLPSTNIKARLLISLSMALKKADGTGKKTTKKKRLFLLKEAKKIGHEFGEKEIEADASGYIGELYEEDNRLDEALTYTRYAVFTAQLENIPASQYLWQWRTGRILRKKGQIDEAISALGQAVAILTPIRSELQKKLKFNNEFFFQQIEPVYKELAELLLEKARTMKNRKRKEDNILAARDTMEQLKRYELQDFFKDECVTCTRPEEITLNTAYKKTAILYPIILENSLELVVTLPGATENISIPIGKGDLTEIVRRFRKRLQKVNSNRYRFYAKKLYSLIIKPVSKYLFENSVETIIIVPDGVLRLIPFSAFYDGEKFLVESFATVTLPSVTIPPPSKMSSEKDILLCGLSQGIDGDRGLPMVDEELRNIYNLFGGLKLSDSRFTVERLDNILRKKDFTIIHMATHGYFGFSTGETYLETYSGKLSMETLEELIKLGRFREKPVELLTLSACESAIGDERAALGLGGVALKAGVKSAVATLWVINDLSASTAITFFYNQLSMPGISRAEALRQAQINMIHSSQFKHPAYWAPFLLIGDWM